MTQLILKTLFLVYVYHVNGQSSCTTPSGGVGRCRSIYQCDALLGLITKMDRTPDEITLLQKSQCGSQGTIPSLCCPETCHTPDGQSGRCVNIFACPHLLTLLKPPVSQQNMQFLQYSRCLDSKQYSVCCGPPQILNLGPTTVTPATNHLTTPLPPGSQHGPTLMPNPECPAATTLPTAHSEITSTLPPNSPSWIPSTNASSTSSIGDRMLEEEIVETPCKTPNGEAGTCKSVHRCNVLLKLVSKRNRTSEETDLLKRSQCGFHRTSPAVCCPSRICYTPNGQLGQCISIRSCPHLVNMLIPPASQESMHYVRNSMCESSEENSVCCGPPPDLNPPTKGNCTATVSAFPPDPRTGCCGVDSRVGNETVAPGITGIDQYPWLVVIEYGYNDINVGSLCIGALISGKYVLTSCQCVTNTVKPVNIRLGEYNSTNEGPDCVPVKSGGVDCTEGAIVIPIEQIIQHPGYNPRNPTKGNDIALLRMQRLAPFTDFIRPICLPQDDVTKSPPPNMIMYAAGWGYSSKKNPNSKIKLHVDLPYVDLETCQARYDVSFKNIIVLWSKQVCAGGVKGKDTCEGDSGSPLMYQNGRTFEMVGATSYGSQPCGTNIPGIYTKIYEYNTWIRSNIRP